MRTIQKTFTVPLYEASVTLVVADDVAKARAKWNSVFGNEEFSPALVGLVSRSGGVFAVFLNRLHYKNREIVAHEVFHLSHRIGDWCNLNFDETHHEAVAILNGWLVARIFKLLKI